MQVLANKTSKEDIDMRKSIAKTAISFVLVCTLVLTGVVAFAATQADLNAGVQVCSDLPLWYEHDED